MSAVKRLESRIDAYHVMRQIRGKLGFDQDLQREVRSAVKTYDGEKVG